MGVPLTGMYLMGVHFMKRACISYGHAFPIGVPLTDTHLISVHAMVVHVMACILWACHRR